MCACPPCVFFFMDNTKYDARKVVRFWKNVSKGGPIHPHNPALGKCWPWVAGRDKDGYGKMFFDRRHMRTHRVSFIIANGSIDATLVVMHSCDNPPCCNPAHLSLGTIADNDRDRDNKEKTGNAKLSHDEVRLARKWLAAGAHYTEVAAIFGVSPTTAVGLKNGTNYRHVA